MVLYTETNVRFWQYVAQLFLEWKILQTKTGEKIKIRVLYWTHFFRKSFRLGDTVEKYCRAGQATGDNMAHAHCMLIT